MNVLNEIFHLENVKGQPSPNTYLWHSWILQKIPWPFNRFLDVALSPFEEDASHLSAFMLPDVTSVRSCFRWMLVG